MVTPVSSQPPISDIEQLRRQNTEKQQKEVIQERQDEVRRKAPPPADSTVDIEA